MEKSNKSAVVIIPPGNNKLTEQIQDIRRNYDKAFDRWMPHINLVYPFVDEKLFSNQFSKIKDEFSHIKPFTISFTKDSFGYFEHGTSCGIWLKPIMSSKVESSEIINYKKEKKTDSISFLQTSTVTQELPQNKSSRPSLDNLRYAVWRPEDNSNLRNSNYKGVGLENLKYAIWCPEESDNAPYTNNHRVNVYKSGWENETTNTRHRDTDASAGFHPSVIQIQAKLQELYPDFNDLSTINKKGFQPHLTLGQCSKVKVQEMIDHFKESWRSIHFIVDHINFISRSDFRSPFEVKKTIYLGQ